MEKLSVCRNDWNKYNANYPARKKAICVLEYIEEKLKLNLQGEIWYELEDELTSIIDNK